jgi:hypothetical protein
VSADETSEATPAFEELPVETFSRSPSAEAGAETSGQEPERPEWLGPMEEYGLEPGSAGPESAGEEVPDWLRAALGEDEPGDQGQLEAETPDWRAAEPGGESPPQPETANQQQEAAPVDSDLYLGDTKPVRVRPAAEAPEESAGMPVPEISGEPEDYPQGEERVEIEAGQPSEPVAEEVSEDWEFPQGKEFPAAEAPAGEAEGAPLLSQEDEEAAMAWLEGLAARQGAMEEDLLTSPEERTDTLPDWVQEIAAEETEEAGQAGATLESDDLDLPPWLRATEAEAEQAVEAPLPTSGDAETPGWLWETEPEVDILSPTTGTPDATPLEETVGGGARIFAVSEPAEPEEGPPGRAAEAEAEPVQASEVPAWAPEFPGPQEAAEPEVEEPFAAAPLEPAAPAMEAPPAEEQPPGPEISTHPELAQAWSTLVGGDIARALEQYDQAIRQEKHLDQVIHDLREATYLFPQDFSVHQALGDAYFRADRLQEALDAYNKAEELLE